MSDDLSLLIEGVIKIEAEAFEDRVKIVAELPGVALVHRCLLLERSA